MGAFGELRAFINASPKVGLKRRTGPTAVTVDFGVVLCGATFLEAGCAWCSEDLCAWDWLGAEWDVSLAGGSTDRSGVSRNSSSMSIVRSTTIAGASRAATSRGSAGFGSEAVDAFSASCDFFFFFARPVGAAVAVRSTAVVGEDESGLPSGDAVVDLAVVGAGAGAGDGGAARIPPGGILNLPFNT